MVGSAGGANGRTAIASPGRGVEAPVESVFLSPAFDFPACFLSKRLIVSCFCFVRPLSVFWKRSSSRVALPHLRAFYLSELCVS